MPDRYDADRDRVVHRVYEGHDRKGLSGVVEDEGEDHANRGELNGADAMYAGAASPLPSNATQWNAAQMNPRTRDAASGVIRSCSFGNA